MSRLFRHVVANEGLMDLFARYEDQYDQIHDERMEVLKEMHDLGPLKSHEPVRFGPTVAHYALNGVVFPDARLASNALEDVAVLAEQWVSDYPRAVAKLVSAAEREVFRPVLAGKDLQGLDQAFNAHSSFFPAGLRRLLTTKRATESFQQAGQKKAMAASENFSGDWFIANINDIGWTNFHLGFHWEHDAQVRPPKDALLAPYRAEEVRLVMRQVERIMDAAQHFPKVEEQVNQTLQGLVSTSEELQRKLGRKDTYPQSLLLAYIDTVIDSCRGSGSRVQMYQQMIKPAQVAIKLCHFSIKRMGK